MTVRFLGGRILAAGLCADIRARVDLVPYRPGLAVLHVGEDRAGTVDVRHKDRMAH